MVIRSETGWNDTYTIRMISGNKIPGLLGFQEKWLDGSTMFYYDITSRQPLNRLTEHKKMAGTEIRILISDLILVLRQMERYLLDERRLCLRPEHIYVEPETYHGSFCLIPGYRSDFTKEFLEFAQYILDHVDHSDGEAVVLAFSVFRESRKENFGVDDIERCLGKGNKATEIVEVPKKREERVPEEKEQGICELDYDFQIIQNEREGDRGRRSVLFIAVIVGMVGLPLCIIFIFGIHFLLRWKWVILALEMLLAAAGISGFYFLNVQDCCGMEAEAAAELELGELVWEMDEKVEKEQLMQSADNSKLDLEGDMQTVLLTSQTGLSQARTLVCLSNGKEISVDYFPFLIGKNKGLVDFCLVEPGVSRLHAKIEREGSDYFITDLNSTNGTKINGSLLEANERKRIQVGDELDFAGILFRFQ